MSIQSNIKHIKSCIKHAELVVVTKHQNLKDIQEVYHLGEKNFGENRVTDLLYKKEQLPNDIKWHMIGHLQTNKVKMIASFIHMIQSVDSLKLLHVINKNGEKYNRKINCLIQVKIAEEETKYGFSIKDAKKIFQSNYKEEYKNINIKGVMGMASFTNNIQQIKKEFRIIKELSNTLNSNQKILSIGMSNDYRIACEEGSNMIRIGTSVFDKNL